MASDVEVQSRKCRLNDECVSLLDILKSFNSAINEEHAWALCYQCAKCFKHALDKERSKCRVVSELEHVLLNREGHVQTDTIFEGGGNSDIAGVSSRLLGPPDHKVVAGLGLVVFKALDFGLKEEEDRYLAPELEQLIQDMTRTDERQTQHAETDDEGIERDSEDDPTTHITLDRVLQCCAKHVAPQPADSYYRNVCRALVTEALDLSMFLDNISQGKVRADAITTCSDLEHLKSSDWARLWMQVIRELRHGVPLKKVPYRETPIEYQLTPYEILMEDIRSRRYNLNKVMVDGNIPRRVKKDAHAVILEFIRSRPPLRKASERKLSPRVRAAATPREALLESIKTGQAKLRPSPSPFKKKVVPIDDSMQPDATPSLKATRRLIKVDFSAMQMDEEPESDGEGGGGGEDGGPGPRTHNPWQRTGTASGSAKEADVDRLIGVTHDEYLRYCDSALECRLPPQNACRVTVTTGCCIL